MKRTLDDLLTLMARLRDPENGCPWDRRQTFATIAPYTIEEAYEVADAIERGDLDALRGELGDLLFQVVFHARMAEEQGAFDFHDVVDTLVNKMERRHPHVFGEARIEDETALREAWEAEKARERGAVGSVLEGVAHALPALVRADKLQKRAARVGFDWPDADGARDKVREELAEVEAARAAGDPAKVEEEIGDLLFAVVNLARLLGVDAEQALRKGNAKFERRFQAMEAHLAGQGRTDLKALDLDTLEAAWQAVKDEEADHG